MQRRILATMSSRQRSCNLHGLTAIHILSLPRVSGESQTNALSAANFRYCKYVVSEGRGGDEVQSFDIERSAWRLEIC